MELIGEASNGREALDLFRKYQPDITLMDLQMPEMNGIDAIGAIRGEFPDARIEQSLVHRLALLLHASFRPRLAAVALAFSLGLHLHQVGRRTFTSKLLSMPSTQQSLRQGIREIVVLAKQ